MNPLRALPTPPAPMPSTAAMTGSPAAANFSGVLDATTVLGKAAPPASLLSGLAKPIRKGAGDTLASDTEDAGTRRQDEPADGKRGSGVAASSPLDIAVLAQLAAALAPAPSPVAPTAAALPTQQSVANASGIAAAPTGLAQESDVQTPPAAPASNAGRSTAPMPATGAPATAVPTGATVAGVGGASVGSVTSVASVRPIASQGASFSAGQAVASAAAPGVLSEAAAAATASGRSDAPLVEAIASAPAAPQGTAPAPLAATAPAAKATASIPPAVRSAGSRAAGADPVVTPDTVTDHRSARDGDGPPASPAGSGGTVRPDATVPVAVPTADTSPQATVTPALQVVAALRSLAPDTAPPVARASGPAASAAVPAAAVTSVAGLKTLTIQLDPGHLGPVSVTVRMRADTVDIQIAVSNPQTLHLLERDRHTLTAAVEALGGSGAALHLENAATAEGAGGGQSSAFASPGGSRQDGSSDAASTGRGRDNRPPAAQNASQSDTDDPISAPSGAPVRTRDGSLYL